MRCVVIPLGIEPAQMDDASVLFSRHSVQDNVQSLLFLSRLDPKKNVEGLLRAFSLLANEWPDLRLVIAGDGEAGYVARLKKLAAELGLADRVVWLGHIEDEQKAAALAAAQVFVLPSFSENFGISAAEALMAGLPCVLGKGVAIADEVTNAGAGLAVDPTPGSIAQGLKAVLSDDTLRASMAMKAAELAREKYSVDAMGLGLVRLYEGIVSRER
jgi:glycosyltransferase involved in cell wall biosynthesis